MHPAKEIDNYQSGRVNVTFDRISTAFNVGVRKEGCADEFSEADVCSIVFDSAAAKISDFDLECFEVFDENVLWFDISVHNVTRMCGIDTCNQLKGDFHFLNVSEFQYGLKIVKVGLAVFSDNTELFAVSADDNLIGSNEREDISVPNIIQSFDFSLDVVDEFRAEGFFSKVFDGDCLSFVDGAVDLSLGS